MIFITSGPKELRIGVPFHLSLPVTGKQQKPKIPGGIIRLAEPPLVP